MRCLKYTLPSTDILKTASEILRQRDSTEVHKSKYFTHFKTIFHYHFVVVSKNDLKYLKQKWQPSSLFIAGSPFPKLKQKWTC